MKKVKNTLVSTKNYVKKHKVAFAIIGTTAVLSMLNRVAIRDYKTFLDEQELNDEFINFISKETV